MYKLFDVYLLFLIILNIIYLYIIYSKKIKFRKRYMIIYLVLMLFNVWILILQMT